MVNHLCGGDDSIVATLTAQWFVTQHRFTQRAPCCRLIAWFTMAMGRVNCFVLNLFGWECRHDAKLYDYFFKQLQHNFRVLCQLAIECCINHPGFPVPILCNYQFRLFNWRLFFVIIGRTEWEQHNIRVLFYCP